MKLSRLLLVAFAVASFVLTLEVDRRLSIAEDARRTLEKTADGVLSRLATADVCRQRVTVAVEANNLAKARAAALMFSRRPEVIADAERFDRIAAALDVDELNVTDERGVTVASTDRGVVGYDFASNPQSAEFMGAIGDKSFALAQKPMSRGCDGKRFGYTGVARRDAPGIVQVGVGSGRIAFAESMVESPERIAHTARVRRGGSVRITGAGEAPAIAAEGGDDSFTASSGDWQVTVSAPSLRGAFADSRTLAASGCVSLAAIVAVFISFLRKKNARGVGARQSAIFALALLTLVGAYFSVCRRADIAAAREQLLLSLENARTRVRISGENKRGAESMLDRSALVHARVIARLVEDDPTLARDEERLGNLANEFGIDEIAVSDSNGVLVAAYPAKNVGFDLSRSAQSAAFLPAVTNASFELVQPVQLRAENDMLFQYAGVARREAPGVVQVGLNESRVASMRQALAETLAAGVETTDAASFIDVSRGGEVKRGYFSCSRGGRSYMCLSARAGDDVVTVGVCDPTTALAADGVAPTLFFAAALLVFAVFVALVPELGSTAVVHLRAIATFVCGFRTALRCPSVGRGERIRRMMSSPVVIGCALAFVFAAGVSWLFQASRAESNARARLRVRAEHARDDVSNSVDNMLFAIARALVRHYRTPAAVSVDAAQELVHRYDIDEVTVVNSNGVVFVTNFGFEDLTMGDYAESAKFNCLLHGAKSYVQPFRPSIEDSKVVRKYAGVPFPDAPGYVQIGIDKSRLTSDLAYLFSEKAAEVSTAEEGFLVWTDGDTGEVVANGAAAAKIGDTLGDAGFDSVTAPDAGVVFDTEFYARRCMAVWVPYAHLRLYAVLPYDDICAGGSIAGVLAILFVIFVLFALFAMRLTTLVESLRSFIASERDRQKSDMRMATTIQMSSLPVVFPETDDFRIFATMATAREVGGDFYDFYRLADGREVLLIADVSGKGVPAAMFMMKAKAMIHAAIAECDSLADAVATANDRLAAENEALMFVTAWVAVYDQATHEVSYVNAGHNPPIVRRRSGVVEWVRGRRSLVLAATGGVKYRAETVALGAGDRLLLYTDGVTEAVNAAGELFGESRLEAAVTGSNGDLIGDVRSAVDAFSAGAEQADDITMLVLERFTETESSRNDADAGGSGESGGMK